jgi:23S rRNA (pseudouridine1915-N3)-methyltransferase
MDIRVIVVGKIKEPYLREGIKDYTKRIGYSASLKIQEVKEFTTSDTSKNMKEEARLILSLIQKEDFLVTCEIDGKMLTSVEFASFIEQHFTYQGKPMIFVIGSSDGLDEEVKKRSNYRLSFSKMTFPHPLMRLVFLEQLYRALSILGNQKYHK